MKRLVLIALLALSACSQHITSEIAAKGDQSDIHTGHSLEVAYGLTW